MGRWRSARVVRRNDCAVGLATFPLRVALLACIRLGRLGGFAGWLDRCWLAGGFGGWLALLLLVPVANLAFWFIPGKRGDNRYGAQPEPPSAIVTLAAVLLPVLLIGAFLASEGQPYMPQGTAPTVSQPPTSLRPYTP